jgi:cyanophycinase-like exopeptidase
MSATPQPVRLLTIMGSGETSPTMVKVHRSILERLGPAPVPAVLLDTPFGFQENASEIAARVVNYFHESLHAEIGVVSLPAPADAPLAEEQQVSRLRSARYVFSGPGSPTYALESWRSTVVPQLLREKLQNTGAVTFASAAALTLGVMTVPVYEIYKVGQPPHWLDGLDLLSSFGVNAAVIPHFNNAEGGTHDTRFCYLGERRLALMEQELPPHAFVLGVDEHTSLTFDIDAGTATVAGLGTITVRARGQTRSYESGTVVAIDQLVETARSLASGASRAHEAPSVTPPRESEGRGDAGSGGNPLLEIVLEQEKLFSEAIGTLEVTSAVSVLLELESTLVDWSKDIPADDSFDRARASFRSMLFELGQLAMTGATPRAEIVGPFVDAMLDERELARAERRFDESDRLRDLLSALGVEVRDTPAGRKWSLQNDVSSDFSP